jgi:CRISPR-associated protein Cas1
MMKRKETGVGDQGEVPQLVPARMLNEFTYCPRLCYIEWVQGEFEDSADTVEGRYHHRRVESRKGSMSEDAFERFHTSSVFLSGEETGAVAKIDLLEGEEGRVVPVDYKRGRVPRVPENAYEPERVQLCVQGLLLREKGYRCEEGVLYFAESRRRVTVPFDEELVARTRQLLVELREMVERGEIPPPLVDSPKCPICSLVGVCLPDEVNLLKGASGEVRRLYPGRDDTFPVYVVGHDLSVRSKGERVEISRDGEIVQSIPFREVSQLSVYGNAYISLPTVKKMMGIGIPICYFSYGGWFEGITTGNTSKNVELRLRQFNVAVDPFLSLKLARRFVSGKIRNCRTLVRRNDKEVNRKSLGQLSRLVKQAEEADRVDTLLGIEGVAAQVYFSRFAGMLREGVDFSFEGRNKRPPEDPVNAVLSYLYGVLVKELFVTLLAVGFDPYLGFFHRPRYGRPALALDLMEEFRPLIADSVMLRLFNSGQLKKEDFVYTGLGVSIKPKARKKVLNVFERRMSVEVRHPMFGYSVSYRRVLEIQARLLSRVLSGELDDYPAFWTR